MAWVRAYLFVVKCNFHMVVGNLYEPSHCKWLGHMIGTSNVAQEELGMC